MKYTNEQLIQVASTYTTFSDLLKNRKLYYLLHNRGILKVATQHIKHTKKTHRNKYTKGVVDIVKVLRPMRRYSSFTKYVENHLSCYVLLKRHGFIPQEVFENRMDNEYMKKLIKEFGQQQLAEFVQK